MPNRSSALAAPGRLGAALALVAAAALPLAGPAVGAVPRLDLSAYPKAGAGERRWVIQLPGVLPPGADPALSPSPADWRVELVVGRQLLLDCNRHRLGGRIEAEKLAAADASIYRVKEAGELASTRKACPPGEKGRPGFVMVGRQPYVLPYNASQPLVVYAPQDLEVRWRLWKAEKQLRPAQQH